MHVQLQATLLLLLDCDLLGLLLRILRVLLLLDLVDFIEFGGGGALNSDKAIGMNADTNLDVTVCGLSSRSNLPLPNNVLAGVNGGLDIIVVCVVKGVESEGVGLLQRDLKCLRVAVSLTQQRHNLVDVRQEGHGADSRGVLLEVTQLDWILRELIHNKLTNLELGREDSGRDCSSTSHGLRGVQREGRCFARGLLNCTLEHRNAAAATNELHAVQAVGRDPSLCNCGAYESLQAVDQAR
mmetsp:Transcript_58276/g.67232  ORF Transcript_58276/g.67232 Transcript_58276/m.67232 type:complete len:240 (-) Transcript_58276:160-879(-)